MMDRDKLNGIAVRKAATTTFAVIDAVQERPPEAQIFGIAAAFRLLSERLGIEPQDAMTVVGNVLASSETGDRVEFDAVRDYLANEV